MSHEFHDDLGQWPITGQMKNNNTYSTPRISFFILNLTHLCNYFHSINVKTCVVQVSDVCEFIRALPGCCDYAEDFAIQEIDGQALMLLKADHLMSAMAMKLGPALKICAKIDTMRGTPPQPSPEK